ncbi:MAG: lipid A export permease/ATP-binding protein MsbA [Gammaproteobacteria bacterium]|nr:lipid A export permease/ATP-binding protein MsbA [Gammaproteobacteria bacterium]
MHPATGSARLYLRLVSYAYPHRLIFLWSLLGMVALGATEWVLPAFLRYLVDHEFGSDRSLHFLFIPLVMMTLLALRGALGYVSSVGVASVAQHVMMDLRAQMFRNLLALPTRFFDQRAAGELLSRFAFDVAQVAQAATHCVTVVVKDTVLMLALIAYMLYMNWRLALFLLVMGPPIALLIARVSARLRASSRRLQNTMGEVTIVAEEAIGGHRDVKVFGGEQYEAARFQRAINNARKLQMKVIGTAAATDPVLQVIIALSLGLMMAFALREAAAGALSRGEFVSFVAATAMLLAPVRRMTSVNEYIQRGLAAAESIFALIDEAPEASGSGVLPAQVRGEICFEGVTLAYDERIVLEDINLTIRAGESVALVGPSGGGKTSLVNLVPRFYVPQTGRILIDGHTLDDLNLTSLRAAIAYVGQHVVLFNDTVQNNIAYGALREHSGQQIEAAADAAFVSEFVRSLPEGFDTLIGDDGLRLSGGQRQRLAIARALLKDAPILILDEATSALDAQSERRIQQALGVLRQGRTCLIVAHRLSTIEACDRIVVIEQGRIVEEGTHAALLERGGAYARLHSLQRERGDLALAEGVA